MKFIFKTVNILLGLTIVTLTTITANTWIVPNYSDRENVNLVSHEPKPLEPLEPLVINRKVKNTGVIKSIVQGNLFHKDRREFNPPVQVRQVVYEPESTTLPPPKLKLKGALLSGSNKIAFIEGSYFVKEDIHGIKKKSLNRKGYPLGAKIGEFELTEIEKTKVTLYNNKGVVLNLNLLQRPEDKVIQKVGNTLIQKSKNFDPGNIKKVSPPRSSSQTILKQPNSAHSKDQTNSSKGYWTRFKREEGQTKQE